MLIEAKSYLSLDKLIVVSAPEKIRVKRVLERDKHRTEKQVYEVIGNQMSEDEKRKLADHIIVNDESELVITQVLKLHQLFSGKRSTH